MVRVIAVANQKGGVGKTTTSVNLAASLVAIKQKVLLIDLDPQGSATLGLGVDKKNLNGSINEALLGEMTAADILVHTESQVDLLPSNGSLTVAEIRLLKTEQRDRVLREVISNIQSNYNFVLIDCPPSLNMLTVNALVAAQSVLVPIQCEYYAMEGLASLLKSIEQIRQAANHDLEIEGILRTMYDGRNRLALEVSEQLMKHFGDKVYQTLIPRNVRLAEAPSHGVPVISYDSSSQGAIAYLALAGEILRRQETRLLEQTNTTTASV